ncbi:unnamed protein product, partial [Ectocarpus sp. 12 AP-2014]
RRQSPRRQTFVPEQGRATASMALHGRCEDGRRFEPDLLLRFQYVKNARQADNTNNSSKQTRGAKESSWKATCHQASCVTFPGRFERSELVPDLNALKPCVQHSREEKTRASKQAPNTMT